MVLSIKRPFYVAEDGFCVAGFGRITLRASVIIAAFNAESTIQAAVRSALDQSERLIEVIVSNDQSTDRTEEAVKLLALQDSRVLLVNNQGAKGPSGARNTAIRRATGDWLVILDADDTMSLCRIEHLTREAERRSLDVLVDNLNLVQHGTGRALGCAYPSAMLSREPPIDLAWLLKHDIPGGEYLTFGFAKPIIKRASLIRSGVLYDEDVRMAEDFLLAGNLIIAGLKFGLSSSAGYNYTREAPSLTTQLRNSDQIIEVNNKLCQKQLGLNTEVAGSSNCLNKLFRLRSWAFRYEDFIYALRRRNPGQAVAALKEVPVSYLLSRIGKTMIARLSRLVRRRRI